MTATLCYRDDVAVLTGTLGAITSTMYATATAALLT